MIPLQHLANLDVDLTKLSANDMLRWGLANLWDKGEEGGYAIRHGSRPVSTFGYNPRSSYDEPSEHLWARSFPVLYPYGLGAPETRRPVSISLSEHVKWSLQHHDKRFRTHSNFAFTAFSVIQRRQALLSARIQMNRSDFQKDMSLFQGITFEKMRKASEQEAKGENIADHGIRMLLKHLHASSSRVVATDASRIKLRSMMWSQSYIMNAPNLWITINPDDIDDPIVQFLAGVDIDLDNFDLESGPNKAERSRNIAEDPYAAAQYFNLIVKAVLESLLAIKAEAGRSTSGRGIFGPISGYFGVVETQGRGALHLHMLIWLHGSPSGGEFVELLKTEAFRERVREYIRANIHGSCPGTTSLEDVRKTPTVKCIAWQGRPEPLPTDEYKEYLSKLEADVARTKQVHTCKKETCMELNRRTGKRSCKRKSPWSTSPEPFIDESGEWGPQRTYPYVNGWNITIATCLRCNHDCKILTNGSESCKLTFYCTCYAAKKQKRSHNTSALLAKNYAFNQRSDIDTKGMRDAGRLMISRCLGALTREQEIAAPMVMSYLMGWGDVYMSHKFVPIFWTSFVHHLLDAFPTLKGQQYRYVIAIKTY